MQRKPRGAISRNAVLDGALAVADRDGLHGVTIRAVAAEIGGRPMSLYTHFSCKDELLDMMLGHVLEQIFARVGQPTWEEELAASARAARSTLLVHPHWLPLFTRVTVPTSSLKPFDAQLTLMHKTGFSIEQAMRAVSSVMAFTLGLVLVERMMRGHAGVAVPVQQLELVGKMMPTFPAQTYPAITSATTTFGAWSFDDVFESGLHSLIAGIAQVGVGSCGSALGRARRHHEQ